MKNIYVKTALAALVLMGGALAATPASAIIYHDINGRAYYYNNWGQQIYYDTGYDQTSYTYYYPSAATATTYVSSDEGTTCREFQRSVWSGSAYETRYGTECMQSDGTWLEQ